MTIQVSITNQDPSREVKVTVQDVSKKTGARDVADRAQLKPGETRSFWIHQLRDLLVEEVNPTTDG